MSGKGETLQLLGTGDTLPDTETMVNALIDATQEQFEAARDQIKEMVDAAKKQGVDAMKGLALRLSNWHEFLLQVEGEVERDTARFDGSTRYLFDGRSKTLAARH